MGPATIYAKNPGISFGYDAAEETVTLTIISRSEMKKIYNSPMKNTDDSAVSTTTLKEETRSEIHNRIFTHTQTCISIIY